MIRFLKMLLIGLLAAYLLLFLLASSEVRACIDVVYVVITGWFSYPKHATAAVSLDWRRFVVPGIAVLFLVGMSHVFVRWVWTQLRRNGATLPPWKVSWTVRGYAMIFALLFAGMAGIGIVHQTFWFTRSPKPMIHPLARSEAFPCYSKLHDIGLFLNKYADEHQKQFPDDFGQLALSLPFIDGVGRDFICQFSHDTPASGKTYKELAAELMAGGHCSFIYCGRGKTPGDEKAIVAIDPPAHHQDDGMPVLYADGHVEWIDIADAGPLLLSLGFERRDPPAEPHGYQASEAKP